MKEFLDRFLRMLWKFCLAVVGAVTERFRGKIPKIMSRWISEEKPGGFFLGIH